MQLRWKIQSEDIKTIKDMKILLEVTRSIFSLVGKRINSLKSYKIRKSIARINIVSLNPRILS